MPKKLDNFDFPHGGRKGIDFDWNSILDGGIWQLTQGADFKEDPKTFVGAASRQANQRNLRVKRLIEGKVLTLQAVPKGTNDSEPEPEPEPEPVAAATTTRRRSGK